MAEDRTVSRSTGFGNAIHNASTSAGSLAALAHPLASGSDPRPLYRPLRDSEFRLLKLESQPDGSDEPVLRLEHFSLDSGVSWHALSYVWNDNQDGPPTMRSIRVNDREVEVTRNLRDALLSIHAMNRRASTSAWLWADALCINQGDDEEKSRQIPLMGRIFSEASGVIIYLAGLFDMDEPGREDYRFVLRAIMRRAREMGPMSDEERQDLGRHAAEFISGIRWDGQLPTHVQDSVTGALGFFFYDHWWDRAWTLQEYVLARSEPVFLIGKGDNLSLGEMFCLLCVMKNSLDPTTAGSLVADILFRSRHRRLNYRFQRLDTRHGAGEPRRNSQLDLARDLLGFLTRGVLPLHCTLRSDAIYGMLGLVDALGLPRHLLPQPERSKPWPEVWTQYAAFLLEAPKSLRVLYHISGTNSVPAVPTWTPDFLVGLLECPQAESMETTHPAPSPTISQDGKSFTASGQLVGAISHLLLGPDLNPGTEEADVIRRLRAILSGAFEPAAARLGQGQDELSSLVQGLLAGAMGEPSLGEPMTAEVLLEKYGLEVCHWFAAGQFSGTSNLLPNTYFLTSESTIGVLARLPACPTWAVDQAVLVLLDGAPFVCGLAPAEDGKYRYLGPVLETWPFEHEMLYSPRAGKVGNSSGERRNFTVI